MRIKYVTKSFSVRALYNNQKKSVSHHSKGVYFLLNKLGEVVYIGWSTALRQRLMQHVKSKKDFCKIEVISDNGIEMFWNENPNCEDIERHFIYQYKPKYNNRIPNKKPIKL